MTIPSLLPRLNEVVVWSVELCAAPAQLQQYTAWLSSDELARANRFLFPDIRERFIVCRAALREILARTLGQPPQQVTFRYGKWGKPLLSGPLPYPLYFNVSHSAELALIGISQHPLGIDVEVPHDRVNLKAIVSQILSPQEAIVWEQLPPQQRNALTLPLWVCKEALLKAMGLGIAEGLKRITFPLPLPVGQTFQPLAIDAALQLHLDDDGTCRTNNWIDRDAWQLRLLEQLPGCVAALAISPRVTELEFRRYEPGE